MWCCWHRQRWIAWHFFIFRFRQRHLPYVCMLLTIYIRSHAVNYITNLLECSISLGFDRLASFSRLLIFFPSGLEMFFFSDTFMSHELDVYLSMFTMCIIACNPQKSTLSLIIVQKCKRHTKKLGTHSSIQHCIEMTKLCATDDKIGYATAKYWF